MTTPSSLERELDSLRSAADESGDERLEMVDGEMMWIAPEPELTQLLAGYGFLVEREIRDHDGFEDVILRTTPHAPDVITSVRWEYDGPTAPMDEVRVVVSEWLQDEVTESVEGREVVHESPSLPDETKTVAVGDGWRAVAPPEHVVEGMVIRRSSAELYDYEVLRSVPEDIEYAEEYDLVEVDEAPLPYDERRRGTPG